LSRMEVIGERTNVARASQVASKVEAKPNMASLPKLRWGSGQRCGRKNGLHNWGTDSNNLLKIEVTHVAAVDRRAGPFWVQHREVR
jgi:hypothetical protein